MELSRWAPILEVSLGSAIQLDWGCCMKTCAWLFAVSLLSLAACTESEWMKPGVTDAEFNADSDACAEMARQQARRDRWLYRPYLGANRTPRYGRRYSEFRNNRPTLSELEFRYRYDCMVSKGYELTPVDKAPSIQP